MQFIFILWQLEDHRNILKQTADHLLLPNTEHS